MLGDGVCVGAGAFLAAHKITRNGKLKRGPIIVGADCTVGPGARLTPHVTVEAGSNVPALVCALPGQTFRRRPQVKGDHTPMPPSGMHLGRRPRHQHCHPARQPYPESRTKSTTGPRRRAP